MTYISDNHVNEPCQYHGLDAVNVKHRGGWNRRHCELGAEWDTEFCSCLKEVYSVP